MTAGYDANEKKENQEGSTLSARDAQLWELLVQAHLEGRCLSGETLAQTLHMTRANVCKRMNALRAQGVPISGKTHEGYTLNSAYDYLCASDLRAHLNGAASGFSLQVLPRCDSTNNVLKEAAHNGAPHGTVVLAEEQGTGRGRLGRSFFSPPGGVYVSLLLRPQISAQRITGITQTTAVAAAQVLERFGGRETQIKWVNDLYIEGKKCAGILTEAGVDVESGSVEWVIIGIGVNCFLPQGGFPAPLDQIATAVWQTPQMQRNALAAALINEIAEQVLQLEQKNGSYDVYLEEYRRRSYLTGRAVRVYAAQPYDAICMGIDENGGLVVRCENGESKTVIAGDVSVRATENEKVQDR